MDIIEENFHANPRRPCTAYFLDILCMAFYFLIGKVHYIKFYRVYIDRKIICIIVEMVNQIFTLSV